MSEPIDIDELRRELDDLCRRMGAIGAGAWAAEYGPRLLDALAALRIAAEPLRKMNETIAPFKAGGALESLADACRLVKLPEGAKK